MYNTFVLPNGIRVVTEKVHHVRSVSLGLWFKAGSVYEKDSCSGMSHFIEHMLFKGTETRTAKEIAECMDGIGGHINAFTSKEYTCYYGKVLDEHLETLLDLLSDMLLYSRFEPSEIEKEKGVILEEIMMYEDSPEDNAFELLTDAVFDSHPLSNSILGEQETLNTFSRDRLVSFFSENYDVNSTVIAIAGNFEVSKLTELLIKYFGSWKSGFRTTDIELPSVTYSKLSFLRIKDVEQAHICLGYPGVSILDDRRYAHLIFNNIFGGSMSSRLFQKIREDKGLAYSVQSHTSNYSNAGTLTIYAGMKPENIETVLSLILKEIDDIRNFGVKHDDLQKAKEQLKGSFILELESTSSRMISIGKTQLIKGQMFSPDEVLAKINAITLDDIFAAVDYIFSSGLSGSSFVCKEDYSTKISALLGISNMETITNGQA